MHLTSLAAGRSGIGSRPFLIRYALYWTFAAQADHSGALYVFIVHLAPTHAWTNPVSRAACPLKHRHIYQVPLIYVVCTAPVIGL